GKNPDIPVDFEDITPFLRENIQEEPEMYVALYADESIPYAEVVKILDLANQNDFKMILVTRPK
ncbi:MAG: biopolymer transporter ExbD, partial [Dysgonamonadaceae bacterium]|nr:biopolymer transporter ExbD [Dysgonamonadaceae bacterium]